MQRHTPWYPACIIAVITALLFGVLNIWQIYLLKDVHPVPKLIVGSDYVCFYGATKNLILKGTPYDTSWYTNQIDEYIKPLARFAYNPNIPWYCFPPVAASLNYPLSFFHIKAAARLSFFLLLASVLTAYGLVVLLCDSAGGKGQRGVFLFGLVTIALSYPVYFLIVRGHLVGITFLLFAAGMYLFKKKNSFCGICLGIATSMFLFPGLIVLPLLLFRRYKIVVSIMATLVVLVLCCPDLWWFFFEGILMHRIDTKDILRQNCSLAAVFLNSSLVLERVASLAGFQINILRFYYEVSLVVYGLLLFCMVFADYTIIKKHSSLGRSLETVLILMYTPFMIGALKVNFPYTLVILLFLIPPLCMLTRTLKRPMPSPIFWLLNGGIALSQFQSQIFETLLNPKLFSCHFFSALGLLMVMIGCVAFKVWLCRKDF